MGLMSPKLEPNFLPLRLQMPRKAIGINYMIFGQRIADN